MAMSADGFLKKKGIEKQHVLYIIKEDKKTAIVLKDGRRIHTIIPAKEFLAVMEEQLISINKGVLLSKDDIVSIRNGVYLMKDGSKHKGRVRTPGQHKRNREMLVGGDSDTTILQNLLKTFAVFNSMPLPLILVEVQVDHYGNPTDYIYRYVNDAFLSVSGRNREDLIDRSIMEIHSEGTPGRMVLFAEVARFGTNKTVEISEPEFKSNGMVYCFRPEIGYCACVAIPQNYKTLL